MTTNPKPNKTLKVGRAGPAWAVTGTALHGTGTTHPALAKPPFHSTALENEVSFVLRNWRKIGEGEAIEWPIRAWPCHPRRLLTGGRAIRQVWNRY